jgi:hypothetical protein
MMCTKTFVLFVQLVSGAGWCLSYDTVAECRAAAEQQRKRQEALGFRIDTIACLHRDLVRRAT